METKMKTRKLYQIRIHTFGHTFGKQVGFKCRLLPRSAAYRIAKRLRKSGHDVELFPMQINLTPEQIAYLDNRYAK